MKADLFIKGGKVIFPRQGIRDMDVLVHQGRVVALLEPGQSVDVEKILDASGKLVLPGVIDAHTHLTLGPGDAGYETETRSAAIGGVTTCLSFLLDAGDLAHSIEKEITAAKARACIDFGLHPSVVTDDQIFSLARVIHEYGVSSLKFYMSARGNELSYLGIPGNDDGFLYKVLRVVASLPGVIPCVHAENIELVWLLRKEAQVRGEGRTGDWDRSRPDFAEAEATQRVLYFAEKANSFIYVAHVTCREALDMVRRAKARRPGKVFAETCPHYLTLHCESLESPTGKVNPPLRHADDVDALWEGVADGTIDVVGSDHVPRRLKSKEGGIWKASPGFPGVNTLLPVFCTEGTRRGVPLERLIEKITSAPASLFGLMPVKGSLFPGATGDITVIDPETPVIIAASALGSDADYSVYEGQTVKYMPVCTILRGRIIVDRGTFIGKPGDGSYIKRGRFVRS